MADVGRLIDDILADPRLKTSRAFANRVYQDEPIVRRASQMTSYLPQRYRDMRAVGSSAPDVSFHRCGEVARFAAQARFMADWEDDFDYRGQFNRYFPTYSMMDDQQLRGYFSWRTRLRRGQVERGSLSFAFVHIYELLNGVGGSDARECFDRLKAFWLAYRPLAPEMDRYARMWMRDFVVWHGLPLALLDGVLDTALEDALMTLRTEEGAVRDAEGGGRDADRDERLFEALAALSSYRIDRSAFARAHHEEVRAVACAVYRDLCRHCAKRRKRTFVDSLFGVPYAAPHLMFESAVVFVPSTHEDCLYRINDAHAYSCRGGRWTVLRQYRMLGRNSELGSIMQTIDRTMRIAWGDGHPLQERDVPKYVAKIIAAAVDACRDAVQRRESRRLSIDRGQLSGIRSRAAGIREELLTDEERDGDVRAEPEPVFASAACAVESALVALERDAVSGAAVVPASAEGADVPDSAAANGGEARPASRAEGPLSAGQARYLCALLDGADAASALAALGSTEDMALDAINEALFDLLGDTALEYGPDGPQVVEEYREDVEGIVRP